jgi:Fic family protein
MGGLRRIALAGAVQASNSIEGYNATLDDVVAAVDGEEPTDADRETQFAVAGYRDAMTYVLQLANDEHGFVDEGLLKALHFMMLKHDLSKNPGRWRPGPIYVRREPSGEIVYEGPESSLIQGLIEQMLGELADDSPPVLVRAAMAHLNLVMIHPFRDGNGRMARCLQSVVLTLERILHPAFSSIEEYLARSTPAYYDVLAEVGQGSWNPQNDARPWVRFCLTAHYRQAKTLERRITESELLWNKCWGIGDRLGLPERPVGALWDAARGLRLRNPTYRAIVDIAAGEEISDLTASRDLKEMVDVGVLTPVGERRGRYYLGGQELREAWGSVRSGRLPREELDPFATAA